MYMSHVMHVNVWLIRRIVDENTKVVSVPSHRDKSVVVSVDYLTDRYRNSDITEHMEDSNSSG